MRWRPLIPLLLRLLLLGLAAGEGGGGVGLMLPVAGSCVTSPFGPRRALGPAVPAGFHRGIDLRAPAGTAVVAMADGVVVAVRRRGAGGLWLEIRHGGVTALYAHFGSFSPGIAQGQSEVRRGERLGVAGRSGASYGAHLYVELRVGGGVVDPELYLDVSKCP